MTEDQPERPTNVRLVLPTGDAIPLELEVGPRDPYGNQLYMAYGPSGMEIPFGARIDFDDMPDGTGLGVALEREKGKFGRIRFADRDIFEDLADGDGPMTFEPGEPDGSLHGSDAPELPEWGKGWN